MLSSRASLGQQQKPVPGWEEPGVLAHTRTQSSCMSVLENTLGNILLGVGLFPEGSVSSGKPNLELSPQSSLVLPGISLVLCPYREMVWLRLFRVGKWGRMCGLR